MTVSRGPVTRSLIELGVPSGPWYDNPDEWDTLILGADTWPGLARVEVTRSQKWDDAEAKGAHGQEPKYQGRGVAGLTITVIVWTSEQYELLEELVARIEPEPGAETPGPLDIAHPVARFRRIRKVKVESIDGPDEEDSGQWSITIHAKEMSPIETKGASGVGPGAGGGGGVAPGAPSQCYTLEAQRLSLADVIALKQQEINAALQQFVIDTAIAEGIDPLDFEALQALKNDIEQGDLSSSAGSIQTLVQDRLALEEEYKNICHLMADMQCDVAPSGQEETTAPPPTGPQTAILLDP